MKPFAAMIRPQWIHKRARLIEDTDILKACLGQLLHLIPLSDIVRKAPESSNGIAENRVRLPPFLKLSHPDIATEVLQIVLDTEVADVYGRYDPSVVPVVAGEGEYPAGLQHSINFAEGFQAVVVRDTVYAVEREKNEIELIGGKHVHITCIAMHKR